MEDVSKSEVITSSLIDAYASASSSSCAHYSTALNESIEQSKVHWSVLTEGASSYSCSQCLTALNESIEESKVHWSVLAEGDSELSDDQIVADNMEVFKRLQLHPKWGRFFCLVRESSVVVHDKFAEGAQAIWNVFISGPTKIEWGKNGEWVLKVFGYLQWMVEETQEAAYRPCVAFVGRGMLLPTGQFAFIMKKEDEDLRRLIVRNKSDCSYSCGPFEKESMEFYLYQIASGMDWLHRHNIVHRDLKASNVLVSNYKCYVADFECSIGVIGTGFWRDPQILQACKERKTSQRPELFTKAFDVYSYEMTCYEILTGKIPFEEEAMTMDFVIEGRRPRVPEFIDDWIKDLLCKCWETNCDARPTFEEILTIIVANTVSRFIKFAHTWYMKVNNDEIKPLLECDKLSHGLEMMECSLYESGAYVCKLCLKESHGAVYHCSSCGDFDLHPGCATIQKWMKSFLHPNFVTLQLERFSNEIKITCDACQLEVLKGNYFSFYTCLEKECDFYLHIHCANYARTISHHLHEEHELVLIYSSAYARIGGFSQVCNGCNILLDPSTIVYCCKECGFNIHPHCIIGKLECKSW